MSCQNFKSLRFILFEKFSGEDFHNLWLRAPNLEPYYLLIYFLTLLLLSTLLKVTKVYLRSFLCIFHHFHFQPTYHLNSTVKIPSDKIKICGDQRFKEFIDPEEDENVPNYYD